MEKKEGNYNSISSTSLFLYFFDCHNLLMGAVQTYQSSNHTHSLFPLEVVHILLWFSILYSIRFILLEYVIVPVLQ